MHRAGSGVLPGWVRPLLRSVDHPVMELGGDVAQHIPADGILLPVKVEKADHSLRLLKGLDEAIQQQTVETPIAETDAILVMLVKGVHGTSSVVRYLEDYTRERLIGLCPNDPP